MHKYLSLVDRKQEVFDMTLARLAGCHGDIPGVGVCASSSGRRFLFRMAECGFW